MAHRTDSGAAMPPYTWQGAGTEAVPPKIDAWQIRHVADRLHQISNSLKSNPNQSPATIAGELEGLGVRLKQLVKHALVTALFMTISTWPVVAGHAPQHGQRCAKVSEMSKQLAGKYKEQAVAFGLQANGFLLQIYATEDGSTWTAVTLTPNGMACIVAAGKNFEMLLHSFEEPA